MNDGFDESPDHSGLMQAWNIQAWKKLSQRVLHPTRQRRDDAGLHAVTAEDDEWFSGDKLDALATVNEDIRSRCKDVLGRMGELNAIQNDFVAIFEDVDAVLAAVEATQSELVECAAMLELEQNEHSELKLEHRQLREAEERSRNEIRLLATEAQSFNDLVSARERRIQALEQELLDTSDHLKGLSLALMQEREEAAHTAMKLAAAEAEIARSENLFGEAERQIASLNDRCATAEFHSRALEERLAETRLDHEIATELGRQREAAASDEFAKLKSSFDMQLSRAEACEKMLTEARAQLHAAAFEIREKDSQIEMLEAELSPLEQRLASKANELAVLVKQFAQVERERALLMDRSQALIRTMNDHRAKSELGNERVLILEQRLATEGMRFATEVQQLESRVRDLTEQVEREKSAHAITSSALQAARSLVTRRSETAGSQSAADSSARATPFILPIGRVPRDVGGDRRQLASAKSKGRS